MITNDFVEIRKMEANEIENAFVLIWEVFQKYVAPDYTQEGVDNFYKGYIQGGSFRKKFVEKTEIMYGAYIEDDLAGVLSLSEKNTVSCVFVKGEYHKNGVGRKLFEEIFKELQRRGADKIKLNASPYAILFYRKLGFKETDIQSTYKGIVYTPMEYNLQERK